MRVRRRIVIGLRDTRRAKIVFNSRARHSLNTVPDVLPDEQMGCFNGKTAAFSLDGFAYKERVPSLTVND